MPLLQALFLFFCSSVLGTRLLSSIQPNNAKTFVVHEEALGRPTMPPPASQSSSSNRSGVASCCLFGEHPT
ncbi:hypothetical protein FN846DRAFT_973850 [Sphaerosporella brunnea]|uniref:Secreted protein n=1 Tax=Sphaerosporella brunnea TaxID=1250544 RepID=A0A5J5EFJ3_9PEZI|nr:hypothetical protein FN846DRAFT_973850 [Sphaerosporella brunnea]